MKFHPKILIFLIASILFADVGHKLLAQNESPGAGDHFLFPLKPVGIDAEPLAKNKKVVDAFYQSLKSEMLIQSQPLTSFSKTPLSLNADLWAKQIMVGNPNTWQVNTRSRIGFQPFWCNVADHNVFALQAVNLDTSELISGEHIVVSQEDWEGQKETESLPTFAAINGTKLATMLKTKLNNLSNKPKPKSALKTAIRFAKHSTRIDIGSSHCLNLLLAAEITERYTTISTFDTESVQFVRQIIKTDTSPMRATRTLLLNWDLAVLNPLKDQRSVHPKLPIDYQLQINLSESVLGNPILQTKPLHSRITVSEQGRLQLQLPAELNSMLGKEEQSLLTADMPTVVKVYGAWVYVDRGRAYGLNIDDRLVVKGKEKDIQGHVVGFYGPKLNLASAKGLPVQEGAIVFIRKGQKLTQVGQSLIYDTKRYPTPWPP